MGRSKTRARRARNGMKQDNFNSKTSPSALKRVQVRKVDHSLGRLYARNHRKRRELKAQLAEELGLPRDAVIIFRRCIKDADESLARGTVTISFGTVVVINKDDLTLVLAARFTQFSTMTVELKCSFFHSISTTYLHARARLPLDLHESIQDLEDEDIFWGWQGGCGWRPGSDKGKSLGCYAVNPNTSAKEDRMAADRERMGEFRYIRDFLAERFASLSLTVFESNKSLAELAQVPGFEQEDWEDTPNGQIFASNLIVTRDFYNLPHKDRDHTRYAFGVFSRLHRDSGLPAELEGQENIGQVTGAQLILPEFGVAASMDPCDGTSELVWDVKAVHYTPASKSYNAQGQEIPSLECPITRYGSSCQITKALVKRIELLHEKKPGMSQEEWDEYRKSRVKSYEEESSNKLMRLEATRLARNARQKNRPSRAKQPTPVKK